MKRQAKKFGVLIMIVAILTVFTWFHQVSLRRPKYYLNFSPSEPRGIYHLVPGDGHLKIGDLVVLEVPPQARPFVYGRGWLPEGWTLLKNVGALPGDEVVITDEALMINNCHVGPVWGEDREGRPLPRLRGRVEIPEGYFFPVSAYIENSFDGRYFGPVSQRLIRGKALPVLVME